MDYTALLYQLKYNSHNALCRRSADAIEALLGELEAARRFAGLVLKAHRNDGYPGDVDGDDLQSWALQCGLIEEREVTESCGEECACAGFGGYDSFPMICYFNTEAGKACIAAAQADKGDVNV